MKTFLVCAGIAAGALSTLVIVGYWQLYLDEKRYYRGPKS